VHALSWPLLLAPDGSKLGKTTGARVFLHPGRTSPYRFFQHWMNTDDRQARELLLKFTLLPVPEIDQVVAAHEKAPERRHAQRVLAREVTRLVHGDAATVAAEEASAVLFGGSIDDAGPGALALVAGEVPTAPLPADGNAGPVVDVLVGAGLASSKSDARRSLESGAVYVNGERVGLDRNIGPGDVRHGRFVVLRKGKKRFAVLVSSASGETPEIVPE
jgi:tyrosyl-tRNA synthetase